MEAAIEADPLKCIGCFFWKPIGTDHLLRCIRVELELIRAGCNFLHLTTYYQAVVIKKPLS